MVGRLGHFPVRLRFPVDDVFLDPRETEKFVWATENFKMDGA